MLSYICFFLCFLMMCFLSILVILHEQQINCTSYSIVWHSCLFWIILISSTRLSTPWMCIVCFIQQVNDYDCLHMLEEKTIALLLYFVDKYKLYSDLKSTLKILFFPVWFLNIKVSKDILLSVKLLNSLLLTSLMCTFMLVPKIVTLSGRVIDVKQCLLCIVFLSWDPFLIIASKVFEFQ